MASGGRAACLRIWCAEENSVFKTLTVGVDKNQDLECVDLYWKNNLMSVGISRRRPRPNCLDYRSRRYFIVKLCKSRALDLREKKVLASFLFRGKDIKILRTEISGLCELAFYSRLSLSICFKFLNLWLVGWVEGKRLSNMEQSGPERTKVWVRRYRCKRKAVSSNHRAERRAELLVLHSSFALATHFTRVHCQAETPILRPPDAKDWLIWKDPEAGKDWRQEEKGMTEDEMVGWHHRLSGHEFE